MTALHASSSQTLKEFGVDIGFGGVTREDNAFMLGRAYPRRQGVADSFLTPMVEGDSARDWTITNPDVAVWPYNRKTLAAELSAEVHKIPWPNRRILAERVAHGSTQLERGLTWFEYSMFFKSRYQIPLSIAFAEIATHNHFVPDRGGKVFKQTAPVIKLPNNSSEDEHIQFAGVLNSSTACFWLKQSCFPKGGTANSSGGGNR